MYMQNIYIFYSTYILKYPSTQNKLISDKIIHLSLIIYLFILLI